MTAFNILAGNSRCNPTGKALLPEVHSFWLDAHSAIEYPSEANTERKLDSAEKASAATGCTVDYFLRVMVG